MKQEIGKAIGRLSETVGITLGVTVAIPNGPWGKESADAIAASLIARALTVVQIETPEDGLERYLLLVTD